MLVMRIAFVCRLHLDSHAVVSCVMRSKRMLIIIGGEPTEVVKMTLGTKSHVLIGTYRSGVMK